MTEYGPPGVWEQHPAGNAATKTGSPAAYNPIQELTSTQKAPYYRDAWRLGVVANKGSCLGGYAFTWGAKWEATATWFGLFLADGARVEAVDALAELWSGKAPPNLCPKIQELSLVAAAGAAGRSFAPGTMISAKVTASDPENDALTYKWSLNIDSEGQHTNCPGVFKRAPEPGAVELQLPQAPGNYRLYAYVYDGKGGAATASTPLQVVGKP